MQTAYILAVFVAIHLLAVAALAQNSPKKMEFSLGTQQDELAVKIEYEDPSVVDARLEGSRVLPVSIEARNVTSQPIAFNYPDIKLNLTGVQPLESVATAAVAEEIRRTRRVPSLLGFLGNQASAFQPNALEIRLEAQRLRDGSIQPGETKKGFVFFIRPADFNPSAFNGVMWIETSGRPPQMLETKDLTVTTKAQPRSTFTTKFRETWGKYFSNAPPAFNKSYALLIGIGKYRHLGILESPAQDVKKMADFLAAQGFDEVVTIRDETVKTDMLRYPQKYFKSKLQPDDRFLFYYSGHGTSKIEGGRPRGYLPLSDEVEGGTTRSVPMDSLVSWMKSLSAQHLLVILDSCFSGLAIDGRELKGGNLLPLDPKVDREALNRLARGPARYLLMAGTAGQQALGGRQWNGSVFTETLITGLRKDADLHRDRIITTRELYVWLKEMVFREAQKVRHELTPLFMDLGPNGVSEGEFVFVQ